MNIIVDFVPEGFIKVQRAYTMNQAKGIRNAHLRQNIVYPEYTWQKEEVVILPVEHHGIRYYDVYRKRK